MFRSAAAPVQPAEFRLAYGAGLVAGLLTLLAGWYALSELGVGFDSGGESATGLQAGDCVDLGAGDSVELISRACGQGHDGQVTAVVTHPDAGRAYPGDDVTAVWFEEACRDATTEFLGADVLTTTLSADLVVPDSDAWDDGVEHAVCYVSTGTGAVDGTGPSELTGSIEGRADDFARTDLVAINRLLEEDCFSPVADADAFGLRSSDVVQLVDCDGSFHGLFFGRARLPYPNGVEMPPDAELTDASTSACAGRFEEFFGVESAVGYTFRFWRPSRSNWDDGDRQVLCAVLSDEPIDGPFTPRDYPRLDMVGTGQCFNLLPEQTTASLSLDDHVRPIRCSEPHLGQMIGGGQFDQNDPFPGALESQSMTERECRSLFEGFVGIEPSASAYGRFPYWFPDEEAWNNGDTRYACAILEDELLTGSLQGTGA